MEPRTRYIELADRALVTARTELDQLLVSCEMFVERYQLERSYLCKDVAATMLLAREQFATLVEQVEVAQTQELNSTLGRITLLFELGVNAVLLRHTLAKSGVDAGADLRLRASLNELNHCLTMLAG